MSASALRDDAGAARLGHAGLGGAAAWLCAGPGEAQRASFSGQNSLKYTGTGTTTFDIHSRNSTANT